MIIGPKTASPRLIRSRTGLVRMAALLAHSLHQGEKPRRAVLPDRAAAGLADRSMADQAEACRQI
jgi:hypothetical protein